MITDFKDGEFIKQTFSYESLMKRRVKKHSSSFQPILEAFSNALEATDGNDDKITIRLKVSKSLVEGKCFFSCIEVEDTGSGFTKENQQRFYDLFNESKGYNNLGTGRIQFLHFFQQTEFNSVFFDEADGKKKQITICLSINFIRKENTPIWASNPKVVSDETPTGTTVSFYMPCIEKDKSSYEELTTDEVCDKVFTHYLGRFCLSKGNMQDINIEYYINEVHDKSRDRNITDSDIPDVDYHDEVKVHYKKINSTGDGFIDQKESELFEIDSFLLPSVVQKRNEIKLTSKNETVEASNVDFSFVGRARIKEGKNMLCLVSSSFLTDQDTDLRGNLNIYTKEEFLKDRNMLEYDEKHLFIDDVQEKVTDKITLHYPAINKIKEESNEDIEQMVEDFSLDKDVIASIGRKTGEKASDFLSRYYHYDADNQKDSTQKLKTLFDSLRTLDPSSKTFKRSLNSKVKEINSLIPVKNKSSLSRYIASRKAAMNILQLILDKDLDCQIETKKRKSNEKLIHDLLFKQGSTDVIESNLWILNEDSIHFKGFSNFELRSLKTEGDTIIRNDLSDKEKEQLNSYNKDPLGYKPDILLFPEEHKCIIIELKSDTADPKDYLGQAVNYASLMREFAKDDYLVDNFYVYLIAESFDFTSIVRTDPRFQISQHLDYVFLPYSPVYGGVRGQGALYMEVLKYSTLLKRAGLRNSIFTEKLFGSEE